MTVSSVGIIKKPSDDVREQLRLMLQEPKQDNEWTEKFVAKVRELLK